MKLATKSAVSLIASLFQAFRLCGRHKEMCAEKRIRGWGRGESGETPVRL